MQDSISVSKQAWLKDAMKRGLLLAIINIFIFLVIYYFLPSKLTSLSYAFAVIVFNITYCFISVQQWRSELGGYIDFGKGFKYVFVLFIASGIIQNLFNALFLYIEPSFPDVLAQSQLDTSLYWAQKFGAPDETLEQMSDKFKPEEITKRFTLTGQLEGFGVSLVFYAIGSAIVALIVRKRQPEEF